MPAAAVLGIVAEPYPLGSFTGSAFVISERALFRIPITPLVPGIVERLSVPDNAGSPVLRPAMRGKRTPQGRSPKLL